LITGREHHPVGCGVIPRKNRFSGLQPFEWLQTTNPSMKKGAGICGHWRGSDRPGLLIVPSLISWLLLGTRLAGVSIALARVTGIAFVTAVQTEPSLRKFGLRTIKGFGITMVEPADF